jgi:RNA polymerase sigma factor (sigma-70 family)
MMMQQSFEAWYAGAYARVRAALVVITGDHDASEDAANEAFTRAFERWPRVGSMASPEAWTTTVALNILRRHWRRQALERRLLRGRGPEEMAPDLVARPIWAEVARLPQRQRTAVALRYLADLPERDIAVAMGVSRGTVASTLSEARRNLERALGPIEAENR